MSSILTVGTLAFDSIQTPFGKVEKTLGGSVNYFSVSASYFAPIHCVSVIGRDFPHEHLQELKSRGVDIEGIKEIDGKTFHWAGEYGFDLNQAHTLDTQLNVLEKFDAELPEKYKAAEIVFLGNLLPQLQMKVMDQTTNPKFVALDTMNFWIDGQKEALIEAISRVHAVIINESEVRQLTGQLNIVDAANQIRKWGPQILVVKQGEYGATLFDHGEVFSLPALPLSSVKDPTGAGDSFAGGFMGYLASQAQFSISRSVLRKAIVYGSVMASFTVQDFGLTALLNCNRELIEERYNRFVDLTAFHVG